MRRQPLMRKVRKSNVFYATSVLRFAMRSLPAALVAIGVATAAPAADVDPGPWYTAEQAERGERVFLTTCAGCHGYEMIENFTEYEDADSYHSKISLTMPWENEGGLRDQNYIDIVAYMLRENGFPAGDAELEIDRELLATIIPVDLSAQ